MLTNAPVAPVIPVTDLAKARDFYVNKLGLSVKEEGGEDGGILFNGGEGSCLYVYQRPPAPSQHTLASFTVTDLESEMEELAAKGVVFEKYDMPGLKTDEKGVAVMGSMKGAWFKDPDGNILVLEQKVA